MTREELTEAIKKSEKRLANLVVEFELALDWSEYLQEELSRTEEEVGLAPNGNMVKGS